MPKTTQAWNPDEYTPVRERVDAFRAAYPSGRIVTDQVSRTRMRVTFRALVYRSVQETEPAATGWASEREGDGEINQSWHVENAETSAVGRALAHLGFHGARTRDSDALRATRRVAEPSVPDARIAHSRAVRGPDPVLQQAAAAVSDVLATLRAAERAGMPVADVRRLDELLGGRSVPPSALVRAERELRAWFDEGRSH